MKNNYHIFYESLIRAGAVTLSNDPAHFDRLLGEGRISLLLEEFSNQDANELTKALQDQGKIIDDVVKALPKGMENTKAVLQKLSGEILGVADVSDIAIMAQKGDSKGLKKKIENLNTIFMRASNLTAAVVQTMINAADNLEPVMKEMGDEEKNLTLNEFKIDGSKKEMYSKVEKILKAVSDSYAVPDWQKSAFEKGASSAQKDAGSLWGAVKGFFSGIFGKVVEKVVVGGRDAFVKDLSNLTLQDIVDAKSAMEKARTALQPVTQAASAGTAGATTDAAPGAGSAQGGAAAATNATVAASTQGVASAAAASSQQPLGKTVLDVIRKFAEPYKDNRAVKASLDNLVGPTRELLGQTEDQLRDALIDKWDEWNDGLPDDARTAIYGAPEDDSAAYDDKVAEMDKAVEAAIQKAVADSLKMESRRRARSTRSVELISEARWAQLAGVKDINK